jgi:acyl transferase domain-containing protein/acyl carrier protein
LSQAIAIIGLSCRFPDAPDAETFWRNLEQGRESLATYSDEEILATGVPPALLNHPNYVKRGTALEDAEWFDASFFGYSAREAEVLDPQHRVFLECAWEALEDAGYGGEARPRRTGVYAGCTMASYLFHNLLANRAVLDTVSAYPAILATDKDFLATRTSYKLNLKGPSLTIQTACSTSLVAVQTACQGLLGGQCDMALAGGVSIIFPQKSGYLYSEGMIFSPDGHCRPFDANAKGIRCGAGAGVVALKRLEDALRDGDSIRAVILGAAINNDGAAKMGYTAPSVEGQAEVIAAAIEMAGVDPATIHYVEAHGTGTEVGDPIEVAALEQAFRKKTDGRQFCALGSVKSNIGHLDAAAGVAGLIKTVLVLQNRKIPPTIHFSRPNPRIDFEKSPFFVNAALAAWPAEEGPRRAGISSFGIGGTNAHAVLEEAPAPNASEVLWPGQLLVLSARTGSALDAMRERLARHLEAHPETSLADACFTLQQGRLRMRHRLAIPCFSREEAIRALRGGVGSKPAPVVEESAVRPVVFLFSGQGSQYAGMARRLYEFQPEFRRQIDICAEMLQGELGCDLRSLLYAEPGAGEAINETRFAQPALFATEYALARMWMSWGVEPEAMAGHSIGEYVAGCLAGVFSLEDALKVVAARGRLMQQMPAGSMLAVSLPREQAVAAANGQASLAAVNSPTLCTLSGSAAEIATVKAKLEASGVACRLLHTSHAFHSPMMDGALDAFLECLNGIKLSAPTRPFVSNLTGTWIRPEEAADPQYWVGHLRGTVRFADGIREIAKSSKHVFLETGPGQALATFTRDCLHEKGDLILHSLPGARNADAEISTLLQAAGSLWTAGVPFHWDSFHEGEKLNRAPLPTYFFERQRYCVEPEDRQAAAPAPAPAALARKELSDWFYAPSWTRTVEPASEEAIGAGPWLILADGELSGIAGELLAAGGVRFATASSGGGFASSGDGSFTINPDRPEDYVQLIQALRAEGLMPRSVLFLSGLKNPRNGRAAFDNLLLLAQAFGEAPLPASLDWIIVGSGIFSVSGNETLDPDQALLLGPAGVISREYANVTCRVVDAGEIPVAVSGRRKVVEKLLREPGKPRAWRPVAYRGGYRWQRTFEPIRLAENPAREERKIRDKGVYVISGGYGGIGLTLATHLAKHARARLGLLSRTTLPAREEWPDWVNSHPGSDAVARAIRAVESLEEIGAEVLPVAVDVSDATAVGRALGTIRERFGAIHGVIHSAGILDSGLVQLRTPEAAGKVLAPKVQGTEALYSEVKDDPLDFFVVCSSVDAVCPAAGSVDYSAANAFQDAFATAKAAQGFPAISINWDAWQGTGMAINTKVPRGFAKLRQAYLEDAIRPEEGAEAFRRVLASGLPQVAVVTRDFPAVIQYVGESVSAGFGQITLPGDETQRQGGHPRPDLATVFVPADTEIEKKIADIWQELLGIRTIGMDDDFFELGGHSLMATGILSRVRAGFGVSMPLRTIFEAPTIRQLAAHVDMLVWASAGRTASPEESSEREEVEL